MNNLALCQVVAAGHSPLQTPAGRPRCTSSPSGRCSPRSSPAAAPTACCALCVPSPRHRLRVRALALLRAAALRAGRARTSRWSGWERALVAGAATLLSSAPLDPAGTYRVPWAMTFLLKPNHARRPRAASRGCCAPSPGSRGWRSRIARRPPPAPDGLGLRHPHGRGLRRARRASPLLASCRRRPDARRDASDVAAVIGINLLVVSPYLVMLLLGHGVFDPATRATRSRPGRRTSSRPPRASAACSRSRLGAGSWPGAATASGASWAAQAVGALSLWLAFYPLSAPRPGQGARRRLLLAALPGRGRWPRSGPGTWRAAPRRRRPDAPRSGSATPAPPGRRAGRAGRAALGRCPTGGTPRAWTSTSRDRSRRCPPSVTGPRGGAGAARDGIVAGDPGAARWIAALTGRRPSSPATFPWRPTYRGAPAPERDAAARRSRGVRGGRALRGLALRGDVGDAAGGGADPGRPRAPARTCRAAPCRARSRRRRSSAVFEVRS